MSDPGYEALRGLWEAKRGSSSFPAWRDFAPGELKRFWPHLMVLDVLPGVDFRYRHYGAGLAILFGNDFTGRTTSSLPANERQRVERDYAQALDGEPRFITMERSVGGIRHHEVHKLILPLGDHAKAGAGTGGVDTLLVLLGVDPVKI